MRPNTADVRKMITPLMSIATGMRRGRSGANTLVLLQTVATGKDVRPSDLAMTIGVHQSSIARQLRTLEDLGQVELTADPDDRRSCFVTLTTTGTEEYKRLTKIGLDRFKEFVKDWDAEEVQTLAKLLTKLETSMVESTERKKPSGGRRWQQKD